MVKRYAYSTCICMKSYDRACIFFYKSHFTWKSLAPILLPLQKTTARKLQTIEKKNNKYICIKTQITNNQIHKKLTTSMKQLRKILIKNFLSIVHKHTTSKCLFLLKLLSLMIVQVNWMSLHWVHTPTRETSMSQLIVCVCHSLCTQPYPQWCYLTRAWSIHYRPAVGSGPPGVPSLPMPSDCVWCHVLASV